MHTHQKHTGLHFAVAGSPASTRSPGGSIMGLERAHALGIDAMELEWVQRVPVNPNQVAEVGMRAKELGISLTIHAPYYVNLNARESEKVSASIQRILSALSMAQIAGASSVCVHAAFYLGQDPAFAMENVRKATDLIMKQKNAFFPDVNLAYETMGKPTQFGTLGEVLAVSKEFGIYPCIDPAHMHARSNGEWNTAEEWHAMFDQYAEALGEDSLKSMHMHYSGIAYGSKGEKHHVALRESDARWEDFIQVLKKREIGGVVVCESPIQEEDTIVMSNAYKSDILPSS